MHLHNFVLFVIAVVFTSSQTSQDIFMPASFPLSVALLLSQTHSLFVFMLRIDLAANSSHPLCVAKATAAGWCVSADFMPTISELNNLVE